MPQGGSSWEQRFILGHNFTGDMAEGPKVAGACGILYMVARREDGYNP